MPRRTEDAPITTPAARAQLAPRPDPYWREIEPGLAIGYRRADGLGAWIARVRIDGRYRETRLGVADDAPKPGLAKREADGATVLDFRQAQKRAIAWAARRRRIAAGIEPEQTTPGRPYTVTEAIDAYLADMQARGAKSVRETREKAQAHILPALGAIALGRLTRETVRDWHRALAEAPRRVRGGARAVDPTDPEAMRSRRATANRILTVLKAALNHARAEGRYTGSPDAWSTVKPFRAVDAPKVRYLTDDEARRLVNACRSDFRLIVTAALLTGMRYGEIAAMRAGDFDALAAILTVPRSKGGTARHIALTDEGCAFFARQTAGRPHDALMFARESGGPWKRSHQIRFMREACEAARIVPPVGFHVLRHTYASRLAMAGTPMAVIAQQLGHADTRMTERHYAHLGPHYVAEAVRSAFGTLGIVQPDNVAPIRARG
jgi:integrase